MTSLSWSVQLVRIGEYEARQFPARFISLFLHAVLLTLCSFLLNNVIVHGIEGCSRTDYWPACWSPISVCGIILYCTGRFDTRLYAKKMELRLQFVERDVHCDASTNRLLVLLWEPAHWHGCWVSEVEWC